MREMKGIFPVFKALMAIIYLLLGAAILVFPTSLFPVNNSLGTVFGIVLVLYGIVRIYISFLSYSSVLKEKRDEEL
jgi:hypothetical protein